MQRIVRVSAKGLRVGEDHPRARLTDQEVDRARYLHEEEGLGVVELSRIYEISKGSMHDLLSYRRRATPVAGTRVVRIPEE